MKPTTELKFDSRAADVKLQAMTALGQAFREQLALAVNPAAESFIFRLFGAELESIERAEARRRVLEWEGVWMWD